MVFNIDKRLNVNRYAQTLEKTRKMRILFRWKNLPHKISNLGNDAI